MKFRIKKCQRAPQQTAALNSAPPRSLGNPYGRLFTEDRKFSDLLTKNRTDQASETAPAQSTATTADRAASTALTAPEKQAK